MSKPVCLIVDDEPDILELLVMTLKPMGISCYTAESVAEAQEYLHTGKFELCLTDMRLPDGDGIELVAAIGKNFPHMPVVVITAHGNVESAVAAMKAGAFDFIAKPVEVRQLRDLVGSALQLAKPRENLLSNLIGNSEAMQIVRAKIEKLARSQAHVYIRGDSGTGKEIAARMIHALGVRAKGAFVAVNCGAIPAELVESEFFGHKKGSFTGAYCDKEGLFLAAQGGTLFLDEVAELPLHMQVKLLRTIQEKHVRPVGSVKEIPVDVRILSATHRDLVELVKLGQFRQDLFYRINVIELYIPPLHKRSEDIPDLAAKILRNFRLNSRSQHQQPRLSEDAMMALKEYAFPGNVRELENILERAITLCESNIVEPEDLQLPGEKVTEPKAGLEPLLKNVEKETILSALEKSKGNKTKAAKLLGINLGALRYRLQKFKF